MNRRFVKVIPGSYIAWFSPDGVVEGATCRAAVMEVPPGGSFIGSWAEKPESNEIIEYSEYCKLN